MGLTVITGPVAGFCSNRDHGNCLVRDNVGPARLFFI